MKGDLYEIDGQRLTFADITRLVPCMSRTAIRNALAKGCKTKCGLLTADMRRGRRVPRKQMQFGKRGTL